MCIVNNCTFYRCFFVCLLLYVVEGLAISIDIKVYRCETSGDTSLGALGLSIEDNTPFWRDCVGSTRSTLVIKHNATLQGQFPWASVTELKYEEVSNYNFYSSLVYFPDSSSPSYPHVTSIAAGILVNLRNYSTDDVFTQLYNEYALVYCEPTGQLMSFGSVLYAMKPKESSEERAISVTLLFTPQYYWKGGTLDIIDSGHQPKGEERQCLLRGQASEKTSHLTGAQSLEMAICLIATMKTDNISSVASEGTCSFKYEILWFKPHTPGEVSCVGCHRKLRVKIITGFERAASQAALKEVDLRTGSEHQQTDLQYSDIIQHIRKKAAFRAEISRGYSVNMR